MTMHSRLVSKIPRIDTTLEIVNVFRELRRVLRDDGTLWLIIGDCYAQKKGHTVGLWPARPDAGAVHGKDGAGRGVTVWTRQSPRDFNLKRKDPVGLPWRLACALRDDGWYLRQDVIWSKPSFVPEPVTTDRLPRMSMSFFCPNPPPIGSVEKHCGEVAGYPRSGGFRRQGKRGIRVVPVIQRSSQLRWPPDVSPQAAISEALSSIRSAAAEPLGSRRENSVVAQF